ncbi:MAG: lycopene cyclase domain-containing protein [Anaerolineales bacterium]|nr:lycopene cyclase domain-containing protein [Anaerolineales bacterium]
MTYFGFLALFLGIPIALLLGVRWWDGRNGRIQPARFHNYAPWLILAIHIAIALVYTTPWDNYLVATRVWWYDPDLVTGITFGWVPIEEYVFFLVQPIFTGLWLFTWMRRLAHPTAASWENHGLRRAAVAAAFVLWLAMVAILVVGWQPGNYLALELGWALLPIMLQFYFGADILWHHRKLIAVALVPTTLYLAFADALAIQSGTWTINPEKSLQWYLGGVLPIEEFIFFLLTNVLIVFGLTLALAAESRDRLAWLQNRLTAFRQQRTLESSSSP